MRAPLPRSGCGACRCHRLRPRSSGWALQDGSHQRLAARGELLDRARRPSPPPGAEAASARSFSPRRRPAAASTGRRSRVRWSVRDLRRVSACRWVARRGGPGTGPPTAPTGTDRRQPTRRYRGRSSRTVGQVVHHRQAGHLGLGARSPGAVVSTVRNCNRCFHATATSGARSRESDPGVMGFQVLPEEQAELVGQICPASRSRCRDGARSGSRPAGPGPGGRPARSGRPAARRSSGRERAGRASLPWAGRPPGRSPLRAAAGRSTFPRYPRRP